MSKARVPVEAQYPHEYTVSIKCDQSPTGRSNIFVLRSGKLLNAIPISYDSETVQEMDMQCISGTGEEIKLIPSDGPVVSIGNTSIMPDLTII